MKLIYFYTEDVKYVLKQKKTIRKWIENVIEGSRKELVLINYIFTSDNNLLNINKDFLNHNTYTDIITFDLSSKANQIEADVFISIDRVKDNAKNLHVSVTDELHRVMIHGVLHLLGYNDKSESQKKQMRKLENHYLTLRF
jgi:rRNA maturation RNase YbeY